MERPSFRTRGTGDGDIDLAVVVDVAARLFAAPDAVEPLAVMAGGVGDDLGDVRLVVARSPRDDTLQKPLVRARSVPLCRGSKLPRRRPTPGPPWKSNAVAVTRFQ